MDITAGNALSLIISGRAIGIAIGPRPILTRRQPYNPLRIDRHGVAETETLLADDAGNVYPRGRAGLHIRKDAAGRHDIHERIGYVRLADPVRRAQRGLRGIRYRCIGRKSISRASDDGIMLNARGTESAGEIQQIAVHVKSGSQRRKAVRIVAFVISVVIEELVDCCIDITVCNLVERADGETPRGAEVVLQPQLSNLGSQVHSGEGLPITFASRVRSIGRQQYALGTGS